MNDIEFRQQILDTKSASFCAAKWYNATIWLGSGMTTSCHHPPAHLVDINQVQINPKLLHNTDQKKADRQMMLNGQRPLGCDYCWKIEDMGTHAVSDRVYKSRIYPIKALDEAFQTPPDQDVNLRTLEIAFDRTCQFACSYCNPAFSTTWVNDIKRTGPYAGLVSDGRNHYTHSHDSAQLYSFGQNNPYVDAFFAWWESDLHRTLQELRITGGEPLMSGYTWQLIDWFKHNQGRSQTRLAINSNLGLSEEKLTEFLNAIQGIPHLEMYTSIESVGAQAEYIRDGLDYDLWVTNVESVLNNSDIRVLHFMCTINALSLETLPQLLDQIVIWKKQYGKQRVNFTLNILRFPSFQSILVLPSDLREWYRSRLKNWLYLNHHQPEMHEYEIRHTQRLIDYIDAKKTPHPNGQEKLKQLNDFRRFYEQYDQRRNKNFFETFSTLTPWYDTIQIQ